MYELKNKISCTQFMDNDFKLGNFNTALTPMLPIGFTNLEKKQHLVKERALKQKSKSRKIVNSRQRHHRSIERDDNKNATTDIEIGQSLNSCNPYSPWSRNLIACLVTESQLFVSINRGNENKHTTRKSNLNLQQNWTH